MYSRYSPSGDSYIPARGHEQAAYSPLGNMRGLFGNLGGIFKGLKRRDGLALDMGDIILLLIILLLFMEDGEQDWMILVAAVLILGL